MITVLLIEDNEADARITEEAMDTATRETFSHVRVKTLEEGVKLYKTGQLLFDVILLDLGLPDSDGIATVRHWLEMAGSSIPIVVVSGLKDQQVMIEAVRMGAQDYIMKDEMAPGVLCRALRYAIERRKNSEEHIHRSQMELENARQKLIEVADSLHTIFVKT
jgi:DNA-binding response OmpR family regulator